jgi:hypothetical protein
MIPFLCCQNLRRSNDLSVLLCALVFSSQLSVTERGVTVLIYYLKLVCIYFSRSINNRIPAANGLRSHTNAILACGSENPCHSATAPS